MSDHLLEVVQNHTVRDNLLVFAYLYISVDMVIPFLANSMHYNSNTALFVCMYVHPSSAVLTDLVSTFSNLLET